MNISLYLLDLLLTLRLLLLARILRLLLSLSSTSSSTNPRDIHHFLLEHLSESFFFLSRQTLATLLILGLCRFLDSR
jgi:hypothetical protein